MSAQEFCLRWNNHQSTVMSVIGSLLQKEYLVDVTLAAEGKMLRAHRLVLCACSAYFEELLNQQTEKQAIVFMKDVKFDELKALVDYMYTGEVSVAQDQLTPFLRTAEALKIKGLADKDDRGSRSQNKTRNHEGPSSPEVEAQLPAAQTSSAKHSSAPPSRKTPAKKKRKVATPAAAPQRSLSYTSEAELDNENFIAVPDNSTPHKVEPQETPSSQTTSNEWKSPAEEVASAFPVVSESYSLETNYAATEETRPTKKASATSKKAKSTKKPATGGNVYACPLCLKSYGNFKSYQRHVRYDCGQEPRYLCLTCGKRFRRSDHLKIHQAKHDKQNE